MTGKHTAIIPIPVAIPLFQLYCFTRVFLAWLFRRADCTLSALHQWTIIFKVLLLFLGMGFFGVKLQVNSEVKLGASVSRSYVAKLQFCSEITKSKSNFKDLNYYFMSEGLRVR